MAGQVAAPAVKTLFDYQVMASTLADLVAAVDEHVYRLECITGSWPEEHERECNMYATARDLILAEAKRVSRELEEGLAQQIKVAAARGARPGEGA